MNAHDLIKEAIAEKGKFDSVYWIACGGSVIRFDPGLMSFCSARQPPSLRISIRLMSSISCVRVVWARSPWSSLVATAATPPEVVEGCEIALAAGATVIARQRWIQD